MDFKNSDFITQIKGFVPNFDFGNLENGADNAEKRIKDIERTNSDIEKKVIAGLVKEFGAEIKNSKSFPLLVDAVVHNLKKKGLESLDEVET